VTKAVEREARALRKVVGLEGSVDALT